MTRTRTPASTSITPLGVRTLVVLFALTLGALFGNARLASAQTGLTPDCVGLVTAFDEMRREVEAALDESASEYIAEQEMYGLSLTPEAVLKSLSVTHQLEQWMERQTREWLDIGPRKVNMPQERFERRHLDRRGCGQVADATFRRCS